MLEGRSARKSFFEPDQYHAVLTRLPETLGPVVTVTYITGWRVRPELLRRERRHVDLGAG